MLLQCIAGALLSNSCVCPSSLTVTAVTLYILLIRTWLIEHDTKRYENKLRLVKFCEQ